MAQTKNFDEVIRNELADDPDLAAEIEDEILNARISMELHRVRTEAKLTQAQLADLIGTKQPVIARLEDANYSGRTLSLLQRIANALDCRITIKIEKKVRYSTDEFGRFAFDNIGLWSQPGDLPSPTGQVGEITVNINNCEQLVVQA